MIVINSLANTYTLQSIAFGTFIPQVFTVLQHQIIKPLHSSISIDVFWEWKRHSELHHFWATFGSLHPWAQWLRLRVGVRYPVWLHLNQRDAWNLLVMRASECKDYLTVGVVARRKWLGLVGRGGLMLRDGVCVGVVVFSALKVFISWATRPRPAQVGALPDDPAVSEASLRDASDAPIAGGKKKIEAQISLKEQFTQKRSSVLTPSQVKFLHPKK